MLLCGAYALVSCLTILCFSFHKIKEFSAVQLPELPSTVTQMNSSALLEFSGEQPPLPLPESAAKYSWLEDANILDMDYFVKTLSGIKAKGVRPQLIGSIITHYASKWLPDISASKKFSPATGDLLESATASWMKKRFFVETIVGLLPPERDSVACNFLLRLLKIANMVGVQSGYVVELEKKISSQLDMASLGDIMIPCFSHESENLYDIELVIRLVKRFVIMDEGVRTRTALLKVAKLVDAYLAEAATDFNLGLPEFVSLAGALPADARVTHDGLYQAVDTYLKAHPGVSKQERKSLCRLIDCRKLSSEASVHAAQNERLPVRAVIQALFSEQSRVNGRSVDWSGSVSTASPKLNGSVDQMGRCLSKREMNAQTSEIRRLKEDLLKVQGQCFSMQGQIEKMLEENNKSNKKKKWCFKWKKLILMPSLKTLSVGVYKEDRDTNAAGEIGTPACSTKKTRYNTHLKNGRRKSIS